MRNFRNFLDGNRKIVAVIIGSVTNGDLTVAIPDEARDSDILGDLRKMLNSLNESIFSIADATNGMSDIIDNIGSDSWQMLEGAKKQSDQAAQIATASEEMSQSITDIARTSSEAATMSMKALEIATKGKDISDGAIQVVADVNESVAELSSHITGLGDSVREIGSIVEVIKDIADQTNLLALNAAIEAARAGEQGRGFSIVADEVRKLAERTIKATTEISERIVNVQNESGKTAGSMEATSRKVAESSGYIRDMRDSLNEIADNVSKVKDSMMQIASAVEEQSSVSEQITEHIEQTAGIARETAGMSAKVMKGANQLVTIEESLRQAVLKFRTDMSGKMMLDIGRIDHRRFVRKVLSAIAGDVRMEASQLPDHHNCRFGKWYDSEGKEKYGRNPDFIAITGPHERVHAIAKDIISAHNSGNTDRAKSLYEELARVSEEIVNDIEALKRA